MYKEVNIEAISITKLLVITILVNLLFDTRTVRALGINLGTLLKNFKKVLGHDSSPLVGNNSTKIQSVQQHSGEKNV